MGNATRFGITRVSDITGLDNVGIPVAQACRPASRSLAVSQGKGSDLHAAMASAVMETIESWHAERVELPLRLGSYEELRERGAVIDVTRLPAVRHSRLTPATRLLWVEGRVAATDAPVLVPHEMVHTDYRVPLPPGSGCFPLSSNGLASGNTPSEALLHALCELVERDSTAVFWSRSRDAQDRLRIDLATVNDPICDVHLERLWAAQLSVAAWDITSDVLLPTFYVDLIDTNDDPARRLPATRGMGSHPCKEVALARALSEAAQCRLTAISGARDDLSRDGYRLALDGERLEQDRRVHTVDDAPLRRFDETASVNHDTVVADVEWLLGRLEAVGLGPAAYVDLSTPWAGLSVVRAIVPGLEGLASMSNYLPGPRAMAAEAA